MDTQDKRRPSRLFGRTLIKSQLQIKFVMFVSVFLLTTTMLAWSVGRFVIVHFIHNGQVDDIVTIDLLEAMNQSILMANLMMIGVGLIVSLLASNLLAGPIYRFEKVFEKMAKGDLTGDVRIRRHDELKDTAEKLNKGLQGLRKYLNKVGTPD